MVGPAAREWGFGHGRACGLWVVGGPVGGGEVLVVLVIRMVFIMD